MQQSILVVGSDPVLASTRVAVLQARYRAERSIPSEAMNRLRREEFELILVCYSVQTAEAENLITKIHDDFPHICIVRLTAAWAGVVDDPRGHTIVEVDFDPRSWTKEIDRLLTPETKAPFR